MDIAKLKNRENKVILVNKQNKEIGICLKSEAHKKGKLHKAFSIFIFNSKNELLLQRRVKEKYHSGGLWSNTVCSHPKPGEIIENATKIRLVEEMGFSTNLKELYSFIYKSDYENGLCEHEFDHVFIGYYDKAPTPNPEEVMDYKWITADDLKKNIKKNPGDYTSWFKIILENKKLFKKIERT